MTEFFNIFLNYLYQYAGYLIFHAKICDRRNYLKTSVVLCQCSDFLCFISDLEVHVVIVSFHWWISGIPSLWSGIVCFKELIYKIQLHLVSYTTFYKLQERVRFFLKIYTEIPLLINMWQNNFEKCLRQMKIYLHLSALSVKTNLHPNFSLQRDSMVVIRLSLCS